MKSISKLSLAAAAFFAAALSSCFTGVESTPRIGQSEVRRNVPSGSAPERGFLDAVRPLPPALWSSQGLALRIDDERFRRLLAPGTSAPDVLKGRTVEFVSGAPAVSLTGEDATDLVFRDVRDAEFLILRLPVPFASLDTLSSLDIPFTIDLGLVSRTDSILAGRRLFIATPDWYHPSGQSVFGLRHVEAVVDTVVPGTFLYPAAVYFSVPDTSLVSQGHKYFLYMSVGGVGAQARSFDRLFEFESPRRHHPEIDDDTWNCIVRSRIKEGMTPTECRLALGAPSDIRRVPTRGGMRETWSYPDGVFLIFDDGMLTRFRQ